MKVYTYNDKVLTNSANGKWLKKKDFVLNADNIDRLVYDDHAWVWWKGPDYPNGYSGDGKQYTIVNNNSTAENGSPLLYTDSNTAKGGPMATDASPLTTLGTSTGTLKANQAPVSSGSGRYFAMQIGNATSEEEALAYLANWSFTIHA